MEIARGPYISGTELKSKSGRALNPERGVVQESDIQTARIDLTVIGTYRTPTRADVWGESEAVLKTPTIWPFNRRLSRRRPS